MGVVLAAQDLGLDLSNAEIDLAQGRIVLRGENGIERTLPVDRDGYFYIDWRFELNDPRLLQAPIENLLAQNYRRLSRASTNHCTQAGGVRRPLSQSCTVRTLRVGAILAAASLCDSWPRAVENSFDQSISYLGCSHCVKSSLTLPLTSARLSSLDAPNSKLLS